MLEREDGEAFGARLSKSYECDVNAQASQGAASGAKLMMSNPLLEYEASYAFLEPPDIPREMPMSSISYIDRNGSKQMK